ncbi:MAG: hydroxymethylbilane synthase [Pyrinomonadaceae bacterium]
MKTGLIIGSRGSRLALWQAEHVKHLLASRHPSLSIDIQVITTTGDKLKTEPLSIIGGKGLFTKEVEEALLAGTIDIAVHSLKDLPTTLPEGLMIGAVLEREDASDAIVFPLIENDAIGDATGDSASGTATSSAIAKIPQGAIVGTSSPRRAAQLKHVRSDLIIKELRGNVDTRLRKLDSGSYTAIILATAGLKRLGFEHRINFTIPVDEMIPAVAQGALAIEIRESEHQVRELVEPLNHPLTYAAITAERTALRVLGGGCQLPIAAHALVIEERMKIEGLVATSYGDQLIRAAYEGTITQPEEAGEILARKLLASGAELILQVSSPGVSAGHDSHQPLQPLHDRTIVITRARTQAHEFALLLESFGARVIECPTIEITAPDSYEAVDSALENIYGYDWLIFTSVNGADHFMLRFESLGLKKRELDRLQVCAIGEATAERLREANIKVSLVPQQFKAEGVFRALKDFVGGAENLRGKIFLIPRAARARDYLPTALEACGARVDVVPVYRTIQAGASERSKIETLLVGGAIDCITFTSSSTVTNFARLFDTSSLKEILDGIKVACIGDITARTAREFGLKCDIQPEQFTIPDLARAIVDYYR